LTGGGSSQSLVPASPTRPLPSARSHKLLDGCIALRRRFPSLCGACRPDVPGALPLGGGGPRHTAVPPASPAPAPPRLPRNRPALATPHRKLTRQASKDLHHGHEPFPPRIDAAQPAAFYSERAAMGATASRCPRGPARGPALVPSLTPTWCCPP